MATTTGQKWLIGCGIGCAVVILVVVGLVTGGVMFVRGKLQPFREASESHKRIVAAYGRPEEYAPPSDGAIAADRLEAFLSVREALKNAQEKVETGLANLDVEGLQRRRKSFGEALQTMNELGNVIIPIGEYMNLRNQTLVDERMGLGEYVYIYSIAYYSFMGHRPDEGPPLLEELRAGDRVRIPADNPVLSPRSMFRRYQRVITRMLRNELAGIRETEESKWGATLKEEIARIEKEPERVAWQDGLPAHIETGLEPYRNRLEVTYNSWTNYFEFLTVEDLNR